MGGSRRGRFCWMPPAVCDFGSGFNLCCERDELVRPSRDQHADGCWDQGALKPGEMKQHHILQTPIAVSFSFSARSKGCGLAFLSQRAADSSPCANFFPSEQGKGTKVSYHRGGVLKSLPVPLEMGHFKAFSLQYRLSCQERSILWIMAALLNDGNAWWLSFIVVFYLLNWPSCLAWALY